jgi:hypothetical protein
MLRPTSRRAPTASRSFARANTTPAAIRRIDCRFLTFAQGHISRASGRGRHALAGWRGDGNDAIESQARGILVGSSPVADAIASFMTSMPEAECTEGLAAMGYVVRCTGASYDRSQTAARRIFERPQALKPSSPQALKQREAV